MNLVIVSPHNAQTFEAFRKRNYPFNRTFILALDSFVRLANRTQLGPLELIGYIRNELIPMGSTAYSYDDHKTNYRLRMADEDVPDSVLTFFDSGQLRSQLNMSRKAFLTLFVQMLLDAGPYINYSLMTFMYRLSQMDGTSHVQVPMMQQPIAVQPLVGPGTPFKKRKKAEPKVQESVAEGSKEESKPFTGFKRRRTVETPTPTETPMPRLNREPEVVTSERDVSQPVVSETPKEEPKVASSDALREQQEKARALGLLDDDAEERPKDEKPKDEKPKDKPVIKTSNLLGNFM
jgi:hypothetical protein